MSGLVTGLQNREGRFDSARYLTETRSKADRSNAPFFMQKMRKIVCILLLLTLAAFCTYKTMQDKVSNNSGKDDSPSVISSPFGDILTADADTIDRIRITDDTDYDLPDMEKSQELIVLTIQNRQTFYEINKRPLGVEYLLAESFARSKGLFIRGELCTDTLDMIMKLHKGIGDVIAVPLTEEYINNADLKLSAAGPWKDNKHWAVRKKSPKLKAALDNWYKPQMREQMATEEQILVMSGGVRRSYHAPVFNRSKGKISVYDLWFKKYSDVCHWDWRLLAAQCYQESMFDPDAQSFAGACGLMQIMPTTAKNLGLPLKEIFNPEKNIFAATRLIRELDGSLRDIPGRDNRIKFILACYNGGILHIRDAQALARADSMWNYRNWEALTPYVLKLQEPEYYTNDSIVKYGYMRGSETVGYVNRIFRRWAEYRGIAKK